MWHFVASYDELRKIPLVMMILAVVEKKLCRESQKYGDTGESKRMTNEGCTKGQGYSFKFDTLEVMIFFFKIMIENTLEDKIKSDRQQKQHMRRCSGFAVKYLQQTIDQRIFIVSSETSQQTDDYKEQKLQTETIIEGLLPCVTERQTLCPQFLSA